MTQPLDGPATAAATKLQLSLTDTRDDAHVNAAVAAANTYVRRLPCAQVDTDPAPADWSGYDDVVLGANMLAARLVRRRNSPDGVQAMTEAGVAYVSRSDPDIAVLLHLGPYAPPAVG